MFLIRNVKSGQCMDLPDTGANPASTQVWMHDCIPAGDNQEWYALPGPSGSSYYVNLASNLCLDVPGSALDGTDRTSSTPLTIYTCWHDGWAYDGADDHLWRRWNGQSATAADRATTPPAHTPSRSTPSSPHS
ncbi:RICIN domain-containing protein [Streptomyces melanogenes]|uniref:RICIN domain-containing protein n=1 Tax=Streptomyces melanogenes TaxID=67326 RepID=UPI003793F171